MPMDPMAWLEALGNLRDLTKCKVNGQPAGLPETFATVAALLRDTRERQGTAWWVGNGGSCAICSHLSQDVLNKLEIRSLVLSDPSLMSCMANDFGYAEVYARPLRRFAAAGDMLIAISSSGNSPNILACADLARERGLGLVTLSAFKEDNELWNRESSAAFFLPVEFYGLAEVGHEALLHAAIECQFLAEKEQKVNP